MPGLDIRTTCESARFTHINDVNLLQGFYRYPDGIQYILVVSKPVHLASHPPSGVHFLVVPQSSIEVTAALESFTACVLLAFASCVGEEPPFESWPG